MRIIAGTYRSRILKTLKGLALRPTSDYLRETLFNVLGAGTLGSGVSGARFLDVFAGTGAVGIEALSRGAGEVVFIENDESAVALIRKNLEALEVRSDVTVLGMDTLRGLRKLAARQGPGFDFIFLDPPYAAAGEYSRVLDFLGSLTPGALLSLDGVVIAEHRRHFNLPEQVGALQCIRVLRHGDAALSFFRRAEEGISAVE
jgi:16S rRNA (guanine966-N2)-methyltransferase